MLKTIRIDDLLLKEKVISQEQLDAALAEQKKTGKKLSKILVALGFITEDTLYQFAAQQLNIPLFDSKKHQINIDIARQLPEAYAHHFHAILLDKPDDHFLIGMTDPSDITAIDELNHVLNNQRLELVLMRESNLAHALALIYRHTDEITTFAEELDEDMTSKEEETGTVQVDAPVIKLVDSLLKDAAQIGASDIHIEPDENILRVRMRVDGILHEQIMKEKAIASAIALRLKLMARLNIAEKRIPQDGRFNVTIGNKSIDIRLSTLPTQYGESVVMRLLDQSGGILDLKQLGLSKDILKRIYELLKLPNGIILLTGPTGSGKTTTLYAALKELNDPTKKIISVEDPVEYRLPRINQVQINTKIDLTFSRVLRTTLRQDPDIVMVGEMRDQETAEIAMRAALTGHLVLSTLHTNDSASSAIRLIDMGIPGYLVAGTLRAILAQRLVRRVCKNCGESYEPSDQEKNWMHGMRGEHMLEGKFRHGKGCTYCNNTGYKGRMSVIELLELNAPMMEALRKNDPVIFAEKAAEALKGKLLLDKAMELAQQGITTIEEAIRIAGESG